MESRTSNSETLLVFDFDETICPIHIHACCMRALASLINKMSNDLQMGSDAEFSGKKEELIDLINNKDSTQGGWPKDDTKKVRDYLIKGLKTAIKAELKKEQQPHKYEIALFKAIFRELNKAKIPYAIASFGSFEPMMRFYLEDIVGLKNVNAIKIERGAKQNTKIPLIYKLLMGKELPESNNKLEEELRSDLLSINKPFLLIDDDETNCRHVDGVNAGQNSLHVGGDYEGKTHSRVEEKFRLVPFQIMAHLQVNFGLNFDKAIAGMPKVMRDSEYRNAHNTAWGKKAERQREAAPQPAKSQEATSAPQQATLIPPVVENAASPTSSKAEVDAQEKPKPIVSQGFSTMYGHSVPSLSVELINKPLLEGEKKFTLDDARIMFHHVFNYMDLNFKSGKESWTHLMDLAHHCKEVTRQVHSPITDSTNPLPEGWRDKGTLKVLLIAVIDEAVKNQKNQAGGSDVLKEILKIPQIDKIIDNKQLMQDARKYSQHALARQFK